MTEHRGISRWPLRISSLSSSLQTAGFAMPVQCLWKTCARPVLVLSWKIEIRKVHGGGVTSHVDEQRVWKTRCDCTDRHPRCNIRRMKDDHRSGVCVSILTVTRDSHYACGKKSVSEAFHPSTILSDHMCACESGEGEDAPRDHFDTCNSPLYCRNMNTPFLFRLISSRLNFKRWKSKTKIFMPGDAVGKCLIRYPGQLGKCRTTCLQE